MTRDRPPADNWDPLSIAEARTLFLSASLRWWVCGGVALELYVGDAWRPHGDLDIGVLRTEAADVYDWLSPDWDLWVAARGAFRPWDGQPLASERDENNVWVRQAADTPWVLDLTVGSGNDNDWIYRRDETI